MDRSMIINLGLYSVFALLTLYLFVYVHRQVPKPYMDEYFHFHQAANYCSGNYKHWDPSITTPPGLYVTTHALEYVLDSFQILDKSIGRCSLALARFTNVIIMLALPFLFAQLHAKMNGTNQTSMLAALCLSSHPLIYFFTFLYYTDVGSLFFIVASLTAHVYQHRRFSALLAIIALTFRQTNIIIVAFEIGLTVIHEFRASNKQSQILHLYTSRSSDTVQASQYMLVIWKYGRVEMKIIGQALIRIIWKCRYDLGVILLFIIFLIKNNFSITLGHQEHHQLVLHLAQMHYYVVYTAFFVSAHLLTTTNLHRLIHFIRSHPIVVLLLLLLINASIKYFTYEHLFLISDNRHYTFYLWSRLFKHYPLFRYFITPIYVVCILLLYFQLTDRSLLNILLLLVCIIIATVFQKLLEFRYFILPFVLLRLSIDDRSKITKSKLLIELLQAFVINSITLYVFCHRTFSWPIQPDDRQRFMW